MLTNESCTNKEMNVHVKYYYILVIGGPLFWPWMQRRGGGRSMEGEEGREGGRKRGEVREGGRGEGVEELEGWRDKR